MLGHVVTKENLLTPWCPIEKKPIALAVRLHPSLHVVSFSAGKGLTHCPISGVPITEFKIVHQDTRLVTCTRDKKVFLDEKSCASSSPFDITSHCLLKCRSVFSLPIGERFYYVPI